MESTVHQQTTIATWAAAVERALHSYPCGAEEVNRLFSNVSIDQSRLMDANYRIPVVAMTKLWRSAVVLTEDDAFGLRVAEFVSPTTFHALGYAAMASKNFSEAVQRIIRNARVVSDIANLQWDVNADGICLYFNLIDGSPDVADEAIDAFMGALIHVSRHYMHADIPLVSAEFVRSAPVNVARFDAFFGSKVLFDCADNRLVVDPSVASALIPTYNATLLEANEKVMEDYLQQVGNLSIADTVRGHIAAVLPEDPVLDRIAEKMHMSGRKLQRKLQAEATSYQKVLDSYRQEKAEAWLSDNQKSIKQVSDLLGFANQSAFTRAFKRWTGHTPKKTMR